MMKYIPIDQKQAIIDIVNSSENDPTKLQADKDALAEGSSGESESAKHGTAVRSNQAPPSSALTSPFVQEEPFEFYEDVLYIDTSGILTFVVKPIKTAKFISSDAAPVELEFQFLDVPRPPGP